MINNSTQSKPVFDLFIHGAIGLLVSLAWPGIMTYLMLTHSDEKASLLRSWPEYTVLALAGIVSWFLLKNLHSLKITASIVFPILSIWLIYYLASLGARQNQILYIGHIFYVRTGIAGMLVYACSVACLMFLSDLPKHVPYGTPIFIFTAYLSSFTTPVTSGGLGGSLAIWFLILVGSIGFLNLFLDLILYLRWEFSPSGERNA